MPRWDWLIKPQIPYDRRFVCNVVLKAAVLFCGVNVLYALLDPLAWLSTLSLYNTMFPGRERLPYADNPTESYNLSLSQLEALFASHVISAEAKPEEEYRVLILGDSATWGYLLEEDETFSACLNRETHLTADGRRLKAYNLGYPITNVTKDALILDYAVDYEPDAIVWFMTLEGMYNDDQLNHPIIRTNSERVRSLIERYGLSLDADLLPHAPGFLARTIIGQRRELADLIRHQFYGFIWTSTHIDHVNPRFFKSPMENFPPSVGVPNRAYLETGELSDYLAMDVLGAGVALATEQGIPILVVNEPIFISTGLNSDLRYNELYPRWIYDAYRTRLGELAVHENWRYVDLWDFVPAEHFTDFPLHYDAEWTCKVADVLLPQILAMAGD